jgi:Zn-dependent protease with chaperone function
VRRSELGQWIFNFAVLAGLLGVFAGMVWLFALAIREGSTVVAAILAALATVSAALIVRYFERRKELEAARRQHLGSQYEQLASRPLSR